MSCCSTLRESVRVPDAIDAARKPRIQRAFLLIYDGRAKHAWWRPTPSEFPRGSIEHAPRRCPSKAVAAAAIQLHA